MTCPPFCAKCGGNLGHPANGNELCRKCNPSSTPPPDLLPCPFCGGEAHEAIGVRGDHGFAVQCGRAYCRASIRGYPTQHQAIERWNARSNQEATPDAEAIVKEAARPWILYHGPLPDYDHPLRPVYESGIQYAVELLAKELGVEDYDICDGTEEFDGDLGGTLLNIVIKTWPTDEHGDWLDLRDAETRAALKPVQEATREETLFDAIAHGDDEHREWLKEAIDDHFAGRPVPPVRGGSRKEARIAELEALLATRTVGDDDAAR